MKKFYVFLPALLSAVLLWPAFFPLNKGWVAYFAIAPLLTLVRIETTKLTRFGVAYLAGFVFFFLALNYVRVAHPMMVMAWIALAVKCAFYWPATIFLIRRLERIEHIPTVRKYFGKPSLAITAPIAWVALEYIRAHLPLGFPILKWLGIYFPSGFSWYFLGHTQHDYVPIIQIADLTGVYGLSFAIAALNGAVAEWLLRLNLTRRFLLGLPKQTAERGWTFAFHATAIAGSIASIPMFYGFYSLLHAPYAKGPKVGAIQHSIPQNEKVDGLDTFRKYDQLCQTAFKCDLIIWPETTFTLGWYGLRDNAIWDSAPDDMRKAARQIKEGIRNHWKTNVLIGTSTYDWDGKKEVRANSAVMIDREGNETGRYDKIHLVPFGEYVPFVKTLPFLQKFTPYDESYSNTPGTKHTRFQLPVGEKQYQFGVVICYEDSDPTMCLPYVNCPKEDKVDFLVNISNDGWFDGTEEHEQHLAICRFRAVETRRTIIRAVNMGISAIIDPNGRVVMLPGDDWQRSKKIVGPIVDNLPISDRFSFYAWAGDWLPTLCWILIVVAYFRTRKLKTV